MEKQKNIPRLRFPEFNGNWDETTIEENFTFKNGINKEKEYFGSGTPIINFTDVYNNRALTKDNVKGLVSISDKEIENNSAQKGDVFFTRTSETIEDIGMSATLVEDIPNCIFSGFVLRARPINYRLNNEFNKYVFSTESIRKEIVTKSSYTTRALTSGTLLNKVVFYHPKELLEQQKIASFLTAVDERIVQLTKKKALLEQYKKGVMQKIFSQEIRFKPDNGKEFADWEERELGEISDRKTIKNKKSKITFVLSNSATQGIVSQTEYFDKDIANQNNLEGYYIVDIDDFVYNPRISNAAPVGPIKRNKKCLGVMSPLYTVFRFNQGLFEFFEYYFETSNWHEYLKGVANYGVRFDRMNITNNDLYKMPIPFPCIEEQTKIANFLSAIDKKIEGVAEVLEATQRWKKGLLQQMFC